MSKITNKELALISLNKFLDNSRNLLAGKADQLALVDALEAKANGLSDEWFHENRASLGEMSNNAGDGRVVAAAINKA